MNGAGVTAAEMEAEGAVTDLRSPARIILIPS